MLISNHCTLAWRIATVFIFSPAVLTMTPAIYWMLPCYEVIGIIIVERLNPAKAKGTQRFAAVPENPAICCGSRCLSSSRKVNEITSWKPTQWRMQDFPQGGAPTPKIAIIFQIFAKNCMKMKEFGPPGGRASLAPPLRSANATCTISGVHTVWNITLDTFMLFMQ